MAYIGHPILGDTVYGAKKEVPGLTGQCLHAVGLRFLHPRTHEVVELSLSPSGGIYKDAAKNQEINCTRYGTKRGAFSMAENAPFAMLLFAQI